MNDIWFQFRLFDIPAIITPGKLIGDVGVFPFAGRWFVQFFASRAAGRVVMPRMFWSMSLTGSIVVLSYCTLGKNDSVGIISNLFPAFVAGCNLGLDFTHRRRSDGSAIANA